MDPVIRHLQLKRFRSVVAAGVDFDNPTFLVGRNGSGKSNIVHAFAFLADCTGAPLSSAFDNRGGIEAVRNRTSGQSFPPNLGIGVKFGAMNGSTRDGSYAFEVRALPSHRFEVVREQCWVTPSKGERVWFDRTKRGFRSNASGLDPALDPAALVLPLVAGDARFAPVLRTLAGARVYAIDPGKVREMQDPDSGVTLRADGSNSASVLREIGKHSDENLDRACEILASIVPNTVSVRPIKHGKMLSLEFTQEWEAGRSAAGGRARAGSGGARKRLKFEAFSMSDGTLRALGLILATLQEPRPSLIVVEEPEATIHPGALGAILDLLHSASKLAQVIVTTHSPEVLDEKWIEDRHLRVVEWRQGATRVGVVSKACRESIQEHLMGAGELLRSNALEAEPLSP